MDEDQRRVKNGDVCKQTEGVAKAKIPWAIKHRIEHDDDHQGSPAPYACGLFMHRDVEDNAATVEQPDQRSLGDTRLFAHDRDRQAHSEKKRFDNRHIQNAFKYPFVCANEQEDDDGKIAHLESSCGVC